jgi:hypothetical protein
MSAEMVSYNRLQTEIEYGALRGGSTLEFFKNSKIPVYERMWEFMSSRPYDVLTNTTQVGFCD